MNKFFRDNTVGILTLSVVGSLIGAWLFPRLPGPSTGGMAEVVSQPIPVWVVFPYSIMLMLAFAVWALRTRQSDQASNEREKSEIRQRLEEAMRDRDSLVSRTNAHEAEVTRLRRELDEARTGSVSRPDLMRFVAVVLSSAKGSLGSPLTHEYVCKHVAGLAGAGVPHAAIGEALASMLHIGAVSSDYTGLVLANDWKAKMRDAGVPSTFGTTG